MPVLSKAEALARIEAEWEPGCHVAMLFPDLGDGLFEETEAVAHLLAEGEVFVSFGLDALGKQTAVVLLVCSDTFGYACADAEPLPFEEIETGSAVWDERLEALAAIGGEG